jgi:hypothetical protein
MSHGLYGMDTQTGTVGLAWLSLVPGASGLARLLGGKFTCVLSCDMWLSIKGNCPVGSRRDCFHNPDGKDHFYMLR